MRLGNEPHGYTASWASRRYSGSYSCEGFSPLWRLPQFLTTSLILLAFTGQRVMR